MTHDDDRRLIGGEEWCALPDLGIPWIKSRVDSGARTSSLHAWNIKRFHRDGREWVSFRVHPLQRDRRTVLRCEARLVDHRGVKSSSGATESRYVISSILRLAGEAVPIEITLTSRDSMGYRMLLGREAMRDRAIVDPSRSFLCGAPSQEDINQAYAAFHLDAPHLAIGVLAQDSRTDLAVILEETAINRGHALHWINPDRSHIDFGRQHEVLECDDIPSDTHLDVILSLLPRGQINSASMLLRHFEHLGAYNPNPSRSLFETSDPAAVYQRLARSALPLPESTWFPCGASVPETLLTSAPLTLIRTTTSIGVNCVALHAGTKFQSSSESGGVLIQSLQTTEGLLRCFVVGSRVVVTRLAINAAGELEQPRGRTPNIGRDARRIIRRAVRVLGIHMAVVDAVDDGSSLRILSVDPFGYLTPAGNLARRFADALLRHLERATGSPAEHD